MVFKNTPPLLTEIIARNDRLMSSRCPGGRAAAPEGRMAGSELPRDRRGLAEVGFVVAATLGSKTPTKNEHDMERLESVKSDPEVSTLGSV